MPRCKLEVPNAERTPRVVKAGVWGSPEEEAAWVSKVSEPATGLLRMWLVLVTGGMFHVFLGYAVFGALVSEFVLGLPWYYTVGGFMAAYEAYVTLSKTEMGGAPDPHIRGQQALSTLQDYLSLVCVIPDGVDLDPRPDEAPPTYVFGAHPHGIHAFGCSALNFAGNDMARFFPRVWHRLTGAVATVIFRVPVVRAVMLAHGYRDASRKACERVLREGRSVTLVLGGEQESIRTRAGRDAVWMVKRKGFVRLAMREGADVVPTYSFGLVDVYHYAYALQGLRMWMVNALQVCVPLFWGVGGTPCPLPVPVRTVVAEPVRVPRMAHPHPAVVEDVYNRYIGRLERLFEDHKAAAGYPEARTLSVERDAPLSGASLDAAVSKFRAYLRRKMGEEEGGRAFDAAHAQAVKLLGAEKAGTPETRKDR